jgi:Spy/CpxP family protein refolding chaperone
MMNIESKSKWQIRLATLSIFVLGFFAGALALNAYQSWATASGGMSKKARYEQIFNQLGMNEGQKTEVQKIVGETREQLQKLREESEPRVKEIRGRADERMRQVLTPEQWQQFQQARDKMRESDKGRGQSTANK